ncbi:MAG TPA: pyruvate dehydrogenase complex dihydrolipoamide acetyltransferase [Rhizomicrobium sp.]|jgi:pyruvate dehydrogenase E2 component (dihydrolipoamide acetyltransferase)|nr:pyruvate dehydrogenase complex dihydrolipoamide acetyltransferase [Rhizomicrobium sp.]
MPTQILMPALSPTMEEGKLAKWHVKEGDEVRSGDVLAEIETDKATMEFEAVDEGRIAKILVPDGTEGVKVNQPIAVLLGEGEDASAVAASPARAKKEPSKEVTRGPEAAPPKQDAPAGAIDSAMQSIRQALAEHVKPEEPKPGHQRIFATPLARRLAAGAGIDIGSVRGSGPRGRIVKADIEAAQAKGPVPRASEKPAARIAASGPATQATVQGIAPLPDARLFYKTGDYEEVPHDSMRKSIAKRLLSAKTLIPHYYLTVDCRIDTLLAARARLNEMATKENNYKLSVNDFVVKAAAMALTRMPEVNASWTENAILRHRHADVGVAVALDFGLITPIVFRAEEKGLVAISAEVKSLAERARTKKLKPQEYEGGSFAISNLGMFGIRNFTAIINPPQAAILAVGAGEARAIVRDGKIEAAMIMTVTMSCDHRVIDGATGARFLQYFRQFVEDPAAMLL